VAKVMKAKPRAEAASNAPRGTVFDPIERLGD
jgi:hypothetical protein